MSGRNDSPDPIRRGGRLLGLGVSGPSLTADEVRILDAVHPAAIILFARNVESEKQLHDLIAAIRGLSDPKPVFMIDQEGGRVDRLRALVPGIPGAEEIANCGDPSEAEELGRVTGSLLAHFDIEVNLAPVVDLQRETPSPSLVGRCFGNDTAAITERAGAFIKGMAEAGVLSCLKHFPGLGVADTDPHHAASVVSLTMDELEAGDLRPYRDLGNMAPSIMVSHGIYPEIDESGLPGTLSRTISHELLRGRLEYDGLAITDDMEMHAVADLGGAGEIAEQSLLAGNDLILFCSRIDEAESIAERLGNLKESVRVPDAVARVEAFVRHCAAWSARREESRGELSAVRRAVAELAERVTRS